MAKTGAQLVTAVRARAGRSNDTVLITEAFVVDALNEAQLHIIRNIPRQVDMDKKDTTTYRIDRWITSAVTIVSATRASTGVVTVSATAHGLEVGDIATIADTSGTDTSFNGNFEVLSAADANTFTYFSNLADEAATTVGTVTKLAAKAVYDITTLAPAHIGGIWILNGADTRQEGLDYVPLEIFRQRYMPIAEESPSEPVAFTRQGNSIYFNCPISRDYQGLNLQIDYTDYPTDLANDSTASELLKADKGLILFALAECFNEIALGQPKFETKALKTKVLFNQWLDEYIDYNDRLIEELYDG